MSDFQTFREPPGNHTFLCKRRSQNPLFLGRTWQFVLTSCPIQVESPFHLHGRTGCCSKEPGPVQNILGPVSMSDRIMSIHHMFVPRRFTGQAPLSTMGHKDLQTLAFVDAAV